MSSKSLWATYVKSGILDSYPAQEMDPPKEFDQLEFYWKEREFVVNGEIIFTASWVSCYLIFLFPSLLFLFAN